MGLSGLILSRGGADVWIRAGMLLRSLIEPPLALLWTGGSWRRRNKQQRRNRGSGDHIFFKNSQNTVALVPSNSVTCVHTFILTLSTQGCLLHASVPSSCDLVTEIVSLADLVPRTCYSAKSLGEADGNRKGKLSSRLVRNIASLWRPRWLLYHLTFTVEWAGLLFCWCFLLARLWVVGT